MSLFNDPIRSDPDGGYPCSVCGERFASETGRDWHAIHEHHKADIPPLSCGLCDERFHHQSSREQHIEAAH